MPLPPSASLRLLAPGIYAYLQESGSWGLSNCGLVESGDGTALLIDTQFTLPMTKRLLAAVDQELPGTHITTVVLTHANGDHAWGAQLLAGARVIASRETAGGLELEVPPHEMTAMTRDSDPASPMGLYMRRFFSGFDFGGVVISPPTVTFSGRMTVQVGGRPVELIEVGPAHTDGDVVVSVPDAGVVFAGDILFIDDHPVMWSGPVSGWVAACDRMLETGAVTFVPGHGPVTDRAGVVQFRSYLEHVGSFAEHSCAAGVPYHVAAQQVSLDGFEHWGHAERLVVTFGAIYRNLGHPEPGGRLALLDRMARRYQELNG